MTLYWTDKNGRKWPVCSCLQKWLPAYQDEMLRQGAIKHSLDLFQAIGDAPASMKYHSTGGCEDQAQQSTLALTIARNMGGAAFPRDERDGMSPHCHIGLKGCPHMYWAAKAQIPSLEKGRNGLVNNKPDRGPRAGIKWPLRTWEEGIAWAKAQADAATKPKPVDPPKVPPTSVTFRLGQLNVCRNRITSTGKDWTSPGGFRIRDVSKGLDWSKRVTLIPGICAQARVSLLTTQETAQYVDRDAIAKALGWGGKVLHGDGDLSNAVFADDSKRKHISDGSFTTAGPHHNECTWVIWQDIATGIKFVVSTSHLIDPAQGSDTLRGQQATAWIKGTEKIAGGLPIIFAGDVNLVRTATDSVGRAFAKYDEAEVVAKVKTNNTMSTTNQLKSKPAPGRRVDRIWVSKSIVVNEITTIFGAPATDHNMVAVSLTVPSK
jgi:endonuclease/exonuclease/phosphatase family metal-dependent hydrolase